jgi:hypothetical protein
MDDQLQTEIADLDLGTRAYHALHRQGIVTLGDLVEHSTAEISHLPNLGAATLVEIQEMLAARGLRLRDNSRGDPAPLLGPAGEIEVIPADEIITLEIVGDERVVKKIAYLAFLHGTHPDFQKHGSEAKVEERRRLSFEAWWRAYTRGL